MKKTIITITGPSASGKSTLERLLCGSPESQFGRVISYTTRRPRHGEENGREYYFVTDEAFGKMSLAGEFLEDNLFGSSRYGATVAEFDRIFAEGKTPAIVVDPNGRRQIERASLPLRWQLLTVYVTNPARVRFERLVERFLGDVMAKLRAGEPLDKLKSDFYNRLAMIEETESKWDGESGSYGLIINNFNADTQSMALDMIAARAIALMTNQHYRRPSEIPRIV